MDKTTLLALVHAIIDQELSERPRVQGKRGPRGLKGRDFNLDEYQQEINQILDDVVSGKRDDIKLRFSDLTEDEVSSLKLTFDSLTEEQRKELQGERGSRGQKGRAFHFEENKARIEELILAHKDELKFTFADLTDIEKEDIRGHKGERGLRGVNGRDFDFEENKQNISNIVTENAELFKLSFGDLSEKEKKELRGERGLRGFRGHRGKDFDFEDSREKLTDILSTLFQAEKQSLKLNFNDLTEEEQAGLKLRYEHLTPENIAELRGSRGVRGQKGKQGIQGEKGDTGLSGKNGQRGLQGSPGIQGLPGQRGLDGLDGLDAAQIVDVELHIDDNEMYFIFTMSDGQQVETNKESFPTPERIVESYFSIANGGSGTGTSLEVRKDGTSLGEAAIMDFTGDNIEVAWDDVDKKATVSVTPTAKLTTEDEGVDLGETDTIDFVGTGVEATSLTGKTTVTVDNLLTQDEGIDLGPTDTIDFVGPGIVATHLDGKTTVEVDAVAGSALTVHDEGLEISNSVSDINFIGDAVKVTAETVMSQWDTLSDVTSMSDYIAGNPTYVNVEVTAPSKFTFDKHADERIELFEIIRMNTQTTVNLCSLDTYSNARATAIALNDGNAGALITGLIFGVLDDASFNFPINSPLFLQDDGSIGLTAPSLPGEFITEVGYSLGTGSIFVNIKSPTEIL